MPARLKTLGQSWTVEYAGNLLSSRSAMGMTHPASRRVIVDANLERGQMVDTLWHELLHVMINNSPVTLELPSEQEERIVRALAPQIVDFLRANQDWWRE